MWSDYKYSKTFKKFSNVTETTQDGDGDISFNEFVWLMTRLNTNGKKTSEEKKQILH